MPTKVAVGTFKVGETDDVAAWPVDFGGFELNFEPTEGDFDAAAWLLDFGGFEGFELNCELPEGAVDNFDAVVWLLGFGGFEGFELSCELNEGEVSGFEEVLLEDTEGFGFDLVCPELGAEPLCLVELAELEDFDEGELFGLEEFTLAFFEDIL